MATTHRRQRRQWWSGCWWPLCWAPRAPLDHKLLMDASTRNPALLHRRCQYTAMALAVAVDAANSPMKGRAYAMPLVTSARWSQVELAKSLHIIYSAILSST